MSKARKTVNVQAVKDQVNHMLENSIDGFRAERIGMFSVLEDILFQTDNYRGFTYLGDYKKDDTRRCKFSCQGF